jgi:hypothetical protein
MGPIRRPLAGHPNRKARHAAGFVACRLQRGVVPHLIYCTEYRSESCTFSPRSWSLPRAHAIMNDSSFVPRSFWHGGFLVSRNAKCKYATLLLVAILTIYNPCLTSGVQRRSRTPAALAQNRCGRRGSAGGTGRRRMRTQSRPGRGDSRILPCRHRSSSASKTAACQSQNKRVTGRHKAARKATKYGKSTLNSPACDRCRRRLCFEWQRPAGAPPKKPARLGWK